MNYKKTKKETEILKSTRIDAKTARENSTKNDNYDYEAFLSLCYTHIKSTSMTGDKEICLPYNDINKEKIAKLKKQLQKDGYKVQLTEHPDLIYIYW